MQVYYENVRGETLCFNHAVKAVVEDDEKITAYVDDVSNNGYDSMVGCVGVCIKCFPEEEELEEEDD